MKKQKIILLGLNEINFEFIERYIQQGLLPNFKKVLAQNGYATTHSESHYTLLEPWIQWVTIHTGKTFDEHKVFRLGDIVDRADLKQLWEIAEEKGLSVGAVSPFNARNNLKNPAFFVPDPWTKTKTSGDDLVLKLSAAVSIAVNGNASNKLGIKEGITLLKALSVYVPFGRKFHYIKMLTTKLKRKATKAAILDNLLADTFIYQWKKHQPDFSSLFLNSGAHEQHHYMFNSKVYQGDFENPEWYCPQNDDPILDILQEYDIILGMLLALNCRLIIATGLHQKPHLHNTYYWRLKNYEQFLDLVGVKGGEVVPRMSRDFLINFSSAAETDAAEAQFKLITLYNKQVFTIDNRKNSLFIELTYDENITDKDFISIASTKTDIDLKLFVAFVAIKNGEHHEEGYLIDTSMQFSANHSMPLSQVFNHIVSAFN